MIIKKLPGWSWSANLHLVHVCSFRSCSPHTWSATDTVWLLLHCSYIYTHHPASSHCKYMYCSLRYLMRLRCAQACQFKSNDSNSLVTSIASVLPSSTLLSGPKNLPPTLPSALPVLWRYIQMAWGVGEWTQISTNTFKFTLSTKCSGHPLNHAAWVKLNRLGKDQPLPLCTLLAQ